jgi:four helix bundle protein
MKDNVILNKSYSFALSIIKLFQHLTEDKREFILSKQLIRCGTSIGANVHEAVDAQSRPDFIHKMSISLKEARETQYWLMLLHDSGYIADIKEIKQSCDELVFILTAIIKSSKENV